MRLLDRALGVGQGELIDPVLQLGQPRAQQRREVARLELLILGDAQRAGGVSLLQRPDDLVAEPDRLPAGAPERDQALDEHDEGGEEHRDQRRDDGAGDEARVGPDLGEGEARGRLFFRVSQPFQEQ